MITPSISAIIPTYNRRSHVCRAVDSILSQSLQPTEVIVVDDGSTDGTAELLRDSYGDRLRIIQQPNGGVSKARRAGLEIASCDWVAFLDSDDEWLPGRLEAMARTSALLDREVAWLFGDTVVRTEAGDETTFYEEHGFELAQPLTIFSDPMQTQFPFMYSLLQSSLISRGALLETGAFLENLRSSEDLLVSLRLASRGPFAAMPNVVTRLYRTPDLAATSLDRAHVCSVDYWRARVIAFGEVAEVSGRDPWGKLHENAVRALSEALMREGRYAFPTTLNQFRYSFSLKALVWALATLVLPPGVFVRLRGAGA